MATLEEAILLATKAHHGQRDKGGMPYILHPLRMMMRMDTEEEMIVAVLHDVVEDTIYTLDDLREAGYSKQIVTAVDCLTRREEESYDEFIERALVNPVARKIKMADIEDNMDMRRVPELHEKDFARLKKYKKAWLRLRQA